MTTSTRKSKTLDEDQFDKLVAWVERNSQHPERDLVMLMLSFKCGLRSCEIARLLPSDVTDADGNLLPEKSWIELTKHITKGKKPDTRVLMHPDLRKALVRYQKVIGFDVPCLMYAPRAKSGCMTPNNVTVYLFRLYAKFGLKGCSSHSGRKTYITGLSRVCNNHGASIKDVQFLARHSDIRTTERYIEPAVRLVDLARSA